MSTAVSSINPGTAERSSLDRNSKRPLSGRHRLIRAALLPALVLLVSTPLLAVCKPHVRITMGVLRDDVDRTSASSFDASGLYLGLRVYPKSHLLLSFSLGLVESEEDAVIYSYYGARRTDTNVDIQRLDFMVGAVRSREKVFRPFAMIGLGAARVIEKAEASINRGLDNRKEQTLSLTVAGGLEIGGPHHAFLVEASSHLIELTGTNNDAFTSDSNPGGPEIFELRFGYLIRF